LLLEPSHDRRGSFVKVFHADTFAGLGLDLDVREVFLSRSGPGVVRGLHFQHPPSDVAKLVCCIEGAVLDAVVDLRSASPTYREHALLELSSDRANALYVPKGCAHGFIVTDGDAVVAYAQSGVHDAARDGGIHWASAGVHWPGDLGEIVLSDRDAALPALDELASPF